MTFWLACFAIISIGAFFVATDPHDPECHP